MPHRNWTICDLIADHVRDCGPKYPLVSGGVSAGSLVTVEHKPEMSP